MKSTAQTHSQQIYASESVRVLPRSAWPSQVPQLRNLFKAKQILDGQEKQAAILTNQDTEVVLKTRDTPPKPKF